MLWFRHSYIMPHNVRSFRLLFRNWKVFIRFYGSFVYSCLYICIYDTFPTSSATFEGKMTVYGEFWLYLARSPTMAENTGQENISKGLRDFLPGAMDVRVDSGGANHSRFFIHEKCRVEIRMLLGLDSLHWLVHFSILAFAEGTAIMYSEK